MIYSFQHFTSTVFSSMLPKMFTQLLQMKFAIDSSQINLFQLKSKWFKDFFQLPVGKVIGSQVERKFSPKCWNVIICGLLRHISLCKRFQMTKYHSLLTVLSCGSHTTIIKENDERHFDFCLPILKLFGASFARLNVRIFPIF